MNKQEFRIFGDGGNICVQAQRHQITVEDFPGLMEALINAFGTEEFIKCSDGAVADKYRGPTEFVCCTQPIESYSTFPWWNDELNDLMKHFSSLGKYPPNQTQTWGQLWVQVDEAINKYHQAFLFVPKNQEGHPIEVFVMRNDRISLEYLTSFQYHDPATDLRLELPKSSVIVIKMPNPEEQEDKSLKACSRGYSYKEMLAACGGLPKTEKNSVSLDTNKQETWRDRSSFL